MLETIKGEILGYEVGKDIVEVAFGDYILEVELSDMEGLEINKDTLAKVIFQKYREKN